MTDLTAQEIFGIQQAKTPKEEAWHREMERRAYDIIRVRNVDDKDFFFDWDHRFHRVPANGTADFPRYLATTYCRNKAVEIINRMNDKLHKQDLDDREKKGLPRFKDKYEENWETYMTQKYPRTDDKELLTKIYSDLWVGLVYEFGKDAPAKKTQDPTDLDFTPLEQKILMNLENRKVDTTQEKPKPIIETAVPVNEPKESILNEVVENEPQG